MFKTCPFLSEFGITGIFAGLLLSQELEVIFFILGFFMCISFAGGGMKDLD